MGDLNWAVWTGNAEEVERLLKQGVDSNVTDEDGSTPLMSAAARSYPAIARMLMNNGADVNMQDNGGWTALHFAAQSQNLEIAQLLLEHGAQVNIQDAYGNTPLARAVFCARGRKSVVEILLRFGADCSVKNIKGVSAADLDKRIANYPSVL